MKRLLSTALGGLLLSTIACSAPAPAALTGERVAASLQASGLPTTKVETFTVDTDPNKLLGRPNQYTAKVSWFDTRVQPQDGLTSATLEVFADAASLDARAKYIAAVTGSVSAFAEYNFRNDAKRVLLRLPHDLTPAQAEEYKTWLGTL